jgi:hypothetical protein
MAICETCGATFTPSLETTEVTSLRILCPECEAKRRAAKAMRTSAAPAAAPKAAATSGPAAGSSGTTASTTIRAVPRTPGSTAAARTNNATPAAGNAKPAPATNNAKPAPAANNAKPAVAPKSAGNSVAKTNSVLKPAVGPRSSGIARARESADAAPTDKSSRRPIASRRSASSPPPPRKSRPSPAAGQARDLHGQVSKKLLHKPGRKPDADREVDFHPDVSREIAMLKQREGKVMKIAWIVCAVLVLAAAGFGLAAKIKHDNEVAAAKKHRSDLDALLVDAKTKYDMKTEDGALKLLDFLDQQRGLGWEEDTGQGGVGAELSTMISLAKANVEQIREKNEQISRLATIEATLADASNQTIDKILQVRRTLEGLVLKDTAYGDDFKARVQAQVKILDRTVLARLRQEAKTLAGGGPDKVRPALLAYAKAEDEATKLLDRAMQLKDEETKKYYTDQFKELLEESNAFVTGVFDPGMIESTAWTDLLSGDNAQNWQNYGLKGFRIEGGKLEAIGPEGGTANGLIDVPKSGGYRDFAIDMEFTLKGQVDALFRLGKRVDNTVESWNLNTNGAEALKPGQTYVLQATYIGSKLTGSLTPADVSLPQMESSWTKSRKGAFGFQMHDGSELRITRLRIRQLRDA